MRTRQQRAALLILEENDPQTSDAQQEACRHYCQEREYQLFEQHIYQGKYSPFERSAPHLVQLRLDLIQRKFDVLVVSSAASLGILPLWMSLPTANAIDEVYRHHVRIESVIPHYGSHDIHQQMLLEGIHLVKQRQAQHLQRRSPHRR